MMHPAQIPQQVNSVLNTSCVVAKRVCHSPMPADPISKVLDDDDLLMEIMVRLGFPTSLICAALVCKHWFRHASDPVFLRRFRMLHPPRLLGFYVDTWNKKAPHFVSIVPQPPEFASVFRHAKFELEDSVMDIRNGIVCVGSYFRESGANYYPLCPEREFSSITPFSRHRAQEDNMEVVGKLVLREEGVGFSYFYVVIESTEERTKSLVHVYTLQDGVWCMLTSTVTDLPLEPKRRPLLVGNKIYILALSNDILVFDLMTLSFSTFERPQGFIFSDKRKGTLLSRADDHSSVYLINLNKLVLCIWLYKGDKYLLVDSVCLHEMLLRISDNTLKDKYNSMRLSQVGDNTEFVLLKIGLCVLYLDIKCRTLRKVYDMTSPDEFFHRLHPLTMIWPPKFPHSRMILEETSDDEERAWVK